MHRELPRTSTDNTQPIGMELTTSLGNTPGPKLVELIGNFNCGIYKIGTSKEERAPHTLHALTELLRTGGVTAVAPCYLDKGSFATIYRLFVVNAAYSLVLKCATQYETLVFSGAQVESFLMRYFFRQFVLTGITPHLPIVLSSVHSRRLRQVYSITEFAHYRSLYFFLPKACTNSDAIETYFRQFLFQIVHTLAWIQKMHPNFRHNDLTTANVLLTANKTSGPIEYRAPNDEVFVLPHHKYRVIMWDFDLSSIQGLADNTRVYRFENEDPGFGISSMQEPGVDLFVLVRWMCYAVKNKLVLTNTRVFETMCHLWPREELLKPSYKKSPHARPPSGGLYLPSAQEVLQSALFDDFRPGDGPREVPGRVYGSKPMDADFLSQTDLDIMLCSNVMNAIDEHEYTIPLAFGAPEDVQQLFLQYPSARAYVELHNKHRTGVEHALTETFTPKNVLYRLDKITWFLRDILTDNDFETLEMKTKLMHTQKRLMDTVLLLRSLQRRYLKLVALVILFNTGKRINSRDYTEQIYNYSGSAYNDSEIILAMMQCKWAQMLIAERS